MTKKLLILAGGKSSRMKTSEAAAGMSQKDIDTANHKTKGMITVNNRPFMDYILYNAYQAGLKEIIILTGEDAREIRDLYGQKDRDNDFHGLKISYAIQYVPQNREKPLGTADAVFQAMEQIPELQEEFFIVCNCDNLYSIEGFKKLIALITPNGWLNYDRSGLDFPQEQVEAFAITHTDAEGFLRDIIEKPGAEDVAKFADENGTVRVSMNIFKFDGNMIYQHVKNCPLNPKRNEKELPTAILNMVREYPKSMKGIPICEHVPDLTRKEDIIKVRDYLQQKNINLNW
ncbi:MAG: sugar phosphate nucleotidyltransferase [Fidelibacterota bacterium]